MRSLSIGARLVAVLLGFWLMALGIEAASFARSSADLSALQARSSALLEAEDLARGLSQSIADQHNGVSDYALTGNIKFLQAYQVGRADEAELFGAATAVSAGFPELAGPIRAIRDAADGWRQTYVDPTVAWVQAGRMDEARSPGRLAVGSDLFHGVTVAGAALHDRVGRVGRANRDAIGRIQGDRAAMFVIGVAVVLVGALAAAWLQSYWVARPLARLLATARRVESGDDVPFPSESDDEIGRLGGALERMRVGLFSQATEANVVNRFTELTAFVEADGDVARATLDALAELVDPADGAIHISSRSDDRAVPEGSIGPIAPQIVPIDQLASCPGVRRSGLYVTGDLSDRLSVRCPVYPVAEGTLACIPLLALGEVVGAVHLHWVEPDSLPLDIRGAVARITEHASLSVANRRLLVALKGMASTDARTGLANSRSFDQVLQDALEARESSEPLSVLMLDLDHFKQFNDRYGHPAGDQVLRTFAGVLQATVRGDDLAARYGGEEFAVLLPGLDSAGAAMVAERIRARIEATIIELVPGHSDKITVSAGVATAPADGTERVELMKVADAALYQAKKAGRNRIVVAGQQFAIRHAAATAAEVEAEAEADKTHAGADAPAAAGDRPKLREADAA
jgi:diguanylate cyclase (GGDEF)-like protein